jgi:hypothetical protein
MKFEGLNSYKTENSARSAIRRQGLHAMSYIIERRGVRYFPLFYVRDTGDQWELRRRGFDSTIDKSKAA